MNKKTLKIIALTVGIFLLIGAMGYFAFVRTPANETPEEPVPAPEPTSTPELTPTPAPVPKLTPTPTQWNIMTWGGDTKEWSKKLNLTGIRWTCGNPSEEWCMSEGNKEARRESVEKYFISIDKVPPSTLKDYARQYSELSLSNPMLQEIAPDDFAFKVLYYWYEELHMNSSQVEALLNEVIDNTKSANPNLKFGVTLYENELRNREQELLDDAHLSPSIRKRIDYVHLFIIYRSNGPGYANDVQTAKRLFPNAKIIAGSYAYDRIDYVPCNRDDHVEYWWKKNPQARCSFDQELSLFRQSLEIQVDLLKRGVVDWIEFFPGSIGNEEQIPWDYYSDYNRSPWSGGCLRPRSECINNTKTLNQIALDVLNSEFNR